MANIKDDKSHDPFPKTGLVRKYAPFIRSEARYYAKMYPTVRYEEILAEAIRLAVEFEPRFDPTLGNDFSTPLRHHLKRLHRFGQKEFSCWQIPISRAERDANDLERKRNGIGGGDPRPVSFSGGNGARITIDVQWNTDDRHRIVIGTQLRNSDWDYSNGVVDRAGPDIKAVLGDRAPCPITKGYIAGIVTNSELRQRETNQEAENQRSGDYAPVFLKPDRQQVDIGFYKGRQPP